MPAKGQITDERSRFEAKVNRGDGCWEWAAAVVPNGYGVFTLAANAKRVYAHRYAHELWKGPIPEGLQVDHLCRNRRCVRPDHLEAVPCRVNLLRGETKNRENALKTHCIHGHPFDEANTYITKAGKRACRQCIRRHAREHQRRKRTVNINAG